MKRVCDECEKEYEDEDIFTDTCPDCIDRHLKQEYKNDYN